MKNINIIKKTEADNFFKRNRNFYNRKVVTDSRIKNLIQESNLKANNILEIGCANGEKLLHYRNLLKPKKIFGIDLSSSAIQDGKKKYKFVNFLKLSSLDLNKIKQKFDLIICGFFLYALDREELFNQFDIIYKKLSNNGYLIIEDFDPDFYHTNTSKHNKKLKTYKMSYSKFLESSGLFKIIYKSKYSYPIYKKFDKRNFKSNEISLTLLKKIDFVLNYPEDL